MKFITFRESGFVRAGVLDGDGNSDDDSVMDLAGPAMREVLDGAQPQVLALIEAGLAKIVRNIEARGSAGAVQFPMAAVELLAPMPRPPRIFGIAHNYHDALAERGMSPPAEPVLFMKAGETVIGPGEPIVLPAGIGGVTYEAELAVVIGRPASSVGPGDALSFVAGYALFNDISASELIKRDGHFDRGKNLPTFGPFGPYILSADGIDEPQALKVGLSVDGKVLQDGSTRDMLFGVRGLISFLSHRQPLEPGDIIATGTPAGVAAMHKPPAWLKAGSSVRASVEGLGSLTNPVIEGSAINVT
jgi:2-keto-4-pentenoate hydratase/2-oxohepta-3-ene-1,7-dioic acid hydratase in catechol pathway